MTPDAPMPYDLRPYQHTAASKYCALAMRKKARSMIVLPTGCGKTRLAYFIIAALGGRAIFLTHTDVLVTQVETEVKRLFPHLKYGVVKGDRDDHLCNFVIASVRTLGRTERLERVVKNMKHEGLEPDLIVVDECHHAAPDSAYQRICNAFPNAHVLGLTATPERLDKKLLGEVFTDGIVYRYSFTRAVDDGWLVPITDGAGGRHRSRQVVVPGLTETVARLADKGKDALTGADKEELREATIAALVWSAEEAVKDFKRRVIAFTLNVSTAIEAAKRCRDRGLRAVYVRGDMKKAEYCQGPFEYDDMDDLLAAHRKGWLDVVFNCNVLLEGHDDPSLNGIIWGRITESRSLWCQGIGRGARPVLGPDGLPDFSRKPDCIVWDLVGSLTQHGLQTAETVFADDDGDEDKEPDLEGMIREGGGATDRERSLLFNFVRALSNGARNRDPATRGCRAAWLPVVPGECYAVYGRDRATYTIEHVGPGDRWIAFREGKSGEPSVRITGIMTEHEVKARAESISGIADAGFDAAQHARRLRPAGKGDIARYKSLFNDAPPATASAGEVDDAITIKIAKICRYTRTGKNGRGIVVSSAAMLD